MRVYSEMNNLIFYRFLRIGFSLYEAKYQNISVIISMLRIES